MRADPYCLRFDPEFDTSVQDMEKSADRWCQKAPCEDSIEELSYLEKYLIAEWNENPESGYSPELLKEASDCMVLGGEDCGQGTGWLKSGCLPNVCQTLDTQAVTLTKA